MLFCLGLTSKACIHQRISENRGYKTILTSKQVRICDNSNSIQSFMMNAECIFTECVLKMALFSDASQETCIAVDL